MLIIECLVINTKNIATATAVRLQPVAYVRNTATVTESQVATVTKGNNQRGPPILSQSQGGMPKGRSYKIL